MIFCDEDLFKCIKNFHLNRQKIFWVLSFCFMYLVSVDPMDRSDVNQSEWGWSAEKKDK